MSVLTLLLAVGCGASNSDGLAKAKAAIQARDPAAAKIELQSFLRSNPDSGEGRYLLGLQLLASDDNAAAAAELQRALSAGYKPAEVIPKLAQAMVKNGESGRLLAQFRDNKLESPEAQADLQASIAQALAIQGDLRGASQAVDDGLALAPKSAPALLMKARLAAHSGSVGDAQRILHELLTLHPTDTEALWTKADLEARSVDGRDRAMADYAKVLELNPEHVNSLAAMVALKLSAGDIEGANKFQARLRKVAPQHLITARHEASLAYAAGDYKKAREVFQSLLRAVPGNPQVLLLAGENELRLGALVQAETMFAKALALAPADPIARRLLAQTQLKAGQAAKAVATLAPLVDAPNTGPEVLALAAEAKLLNGDAKGASALYDRAGKLKPTDPRLRTIVATAGFGRDKDDAILDELRSISKQDRGTSADMALISAHLRKGDTDAALKALAALDSKRPNDPTRHVLRGQILIGKKDMQQARTAFEDALKLSPGLMTAVNALVALDLREQKPEDARKRFDDLIKAQPTNAQAMLGSAALNARLGSPRSDIRNLIEAAVKAAPASQEARIALIAHHFDARDFDAALTAAQAANTDMPDNVDLLELLARCQMRKNEASQALTSYGKVAQLLPRSPRGPIGMAEVYIQTGDYDSAQKSIQRALQLSPGNPESRAQAIIVAMRKSQPAQALEIARSMQRDQPTDSKGWVLEGEIEASQARWDLAAAAYKQALNKADSGAAHLKYYGALARGGKLAEAEAFAAGWVKSHPQDTTFLFFLGDAAQARGDKGQAAKHYEAVLASQDGHAFALNNLAMLRLQGQEPGALALAERAVKAAPNQPAILDTLAQALAADKQFGKAIEAQSRAVALAPDAPAFRLALAKLLIQDGDKARAKTELLALAKRGPSIPQQDEVAKMLSALN